MSQRLQSGLRRVPNDQLENEDEEKVAVGDTSF